MGSSFNGPNSPKDQFFAAADDTDLSGPPVPPDQLVADEPDGLAVDDAQESAAAAGGE